MTNHQGPHLHLHYHHLLLLLLLLLLHISLITHGPPSTVHPS
jgi:hypothetical protein